jgi:hypothetical protein
MTTPPMENERRTPVTALPRKNWYDVGRDDALAGRAYRPAKVPVQYSMEYRLGYESVRHENDPMLDIVRAHGGVAPDTKPEDM